MSGAAFIIGTNLMVAGLFMATFMSIAIHSRYRSAWWFAACYAAGMGYLGLEAFLPLFRDPRMPLLLGSTSLITGMLFLNIGLMVRYGQRLSPTLLTGVFALSIVASALTVDMPRDSLLRMFLYQAPYAAMQAIGAWIVLTSGRKMAADRVLGIFLVLSALHFLSKPLIAIVVGGPGADPQAYIGTTYAMVSQSLGVVLSVATALLLLVMLLRDVLKDMTDKSETDLLSGLLNRRGFEERLKDVAAHRYANGMPVALVICDLDHFKSINDTYGHAIGDRVIAAFADTLRANAAAHHVLGRIGGEEFAAILPGSNLAAGRLFAETVRTAFSARTLDDLPLRSTASFGVAEMAPGETAPAFMVRTDAALYEAKRSGRDRVCTNRMQQVVDNSPSANEA